QQINDTIDTTDPDANPSGDNTPPSTTSTNQFKDGTYTALGNYTSPGGAEQIKVTVTLKDDIITDATVVSTIAEQSESRQNQNRFISGYKALVIGKKITDVHLTRVSGSSLTPIGWNDAIAKIETQAK